MFTTYVVVWNITNAVSLFGSVYLLKCESAGELFLFNGRERLHDNNGSF